MIPTLRRFTFPLMAGAACAALALPCLGARPALTINAEVTTPAVMEIEGRITGHAAEKVREIMHRAGIDYRIKLLPWKRAFTLAQTTPATCVLMTTRTEERERQFVWVGPISQTDWVLYGRAGRNYAIKRLDDARGLRIGAYHGDVRGEYLAARGMSVDFAANDESNPKKLALGRVDLWVNSTRSSRPMLAQLQLSDKIVPVFTFKFVTLHLACHPGIEPAILARMHAALRAMEADGTYRAIEQRFDHSRKP